MHRSVGRFLSSDATHFARVLKVNVIQPASADPGTGAGGYGILTVDCILNDMSATYHNVPVGFGFGGPIRLPREGMQIALTYPWGSTQYPIATCRQLTPTPYTPGYDDQLPVQLENQDDEVWYHPETKAWIRFRNTSSTAAGPNAAPDGSPCQFDLQFASGLKLTILENASVPPVAGADPTPPDSASLTLTLPHGAGTVTMVQPSIGKAVVTTTLTTAQGTVATTVDGVNQAITHAATTAHGTATSKIDAVAQTIEHAIPTAIGSATTLIDAANQAVMHAITTAEGTATSKIDAAAQKITHSIPSAAGLISMEADAVNNQIGHILPAGGKFGVGDLPSNLAAVNAMVNNSHLTDYESLRQAANLADLVANAHLDESLGIITPTQLADKLAVLVGGFASSIGMTGIGSAVGFTKS